MNEQSNPTTGASARWWAGAVLIVAGFSLAGLSMGLLIGVAMQGADHRPLLYVLVALAGITTVTGRLLVTRRKRSQSQPKQGLVPR